MTIWGCTPVNWHSWLENGSGLKMYGPYWTWGMSFQPAMWSFLQKVDTWIPKGLEVRTACLLLDLFFLGSTSNGNQFGRGVIIECPKPPVWPPGLVRPILFKCCRLEEPIQPNLVLQYVWEKNASPWKGNLESQQKVPQSPEIRVTNPQGMIIIPLRNLSPERTPQNPIQ